VVELMRDEKEILKAVPVRRRSAARLAAVQITYQSLITGHSALNFVHQFLANYADDVAKSFKVKHLDEAHLTALYAGVENNMEAIDSAIAAQLVDGWSLDRLTRIELSVLRCGTYEIQSMLDIPVRAAVSEYAALSDACGCDVAFVNALLDQLARAARIVEMDKQR
jgi:N utilization substance protein B